MNLKYFTFHFPWRLRKALVMVRVKPVPGTRPIAELGRRSFTICILDNTRRKGENYCPHCPHEYYIDNSGKEQQSGTVGLGGVVKMWAFKTVIK